MKNAAIFFLLLCLFAGSGCFNVREPEKPAAQSEWISPTQPEMLLSNFRLAVGQLNIANYERCLVPASFRFVADPEIAGSTTLFMGWSLEEEREYMNSLRSRTIAGRTNNLLLTEGREAFFTPDSLEYTALYRLTLAHSDTVKFPAKEVRGTLRFLLRRKNNEWQISYWQDQREAGFACWSDVKQHFISP